MSGRSRRARAVLHAEELDAVVTELLEFGRGRGERLRSERNEDGVQTREERPDVQPLLLDALRLALEDEVVPAVETDAPEDFPTPMDRAVCERLASTPEGRDYLLRLAVRV